MKPSLLQLLCSLTTAAAAFAGPIAAPAPPESEAWADGPYFLGDWGGARTRLAEAGVTFDSYYVANPAGNVRGGLEDGFSYVDNFYLGLSLDLGKLVGWEGATFMISGVNRSGGSVTEAYVGSRYDVQQVHGGQNVFLYQLTLEQRFWDDKGRIKVGRFGASDDFNRSPFYGLFMNNGIDGNIRNVLFDTQFSAYPFATWAARVRLDPTPEVKVQLGVFQTWEEIFDRTHNGLDWGVRGDDGVMFLAQIGWTPELFKRPVPSGATRAAGDGKKAVVAEDRREGLPGHYWIGGSYSPWDGFAQFGKSETASGSYGFYAHADQMVFRERAGSDEGLTLFLAAGYYPQENLSVIPFQVNAGGFYTGLIPGRDRDKTILGVIHGRFGDDYADTVEQTGGGDPTQETVVEFGHRIQFTRFAYLQPNVQYIHRPGGTGTIDDAVVVGAQFGITF